MEPMPVVAEEETDRSLAFEETMGRDTRIEALLTDWKLTWELDAEFSVTKVRKDNAVQIRTEAHRAPAMTVEQYVTHMKHGAVFPPIVITQTNLLVDGNTRLAAAGRLGRKTFPAYKVKFSNMGMARMIGAALNQMGGDRLTDEEIVIAAEVMMAENYPDESIARALGRSVTHVRNVRRDRTYREAAERTGVAEIQLPKALQRTLANISHDEPFKAAVEVIARTKPSVKDASDLVDRVEKTRSDAEALKAIREIETKWGPIAGPPPNGHRSVSRSQAKKALKLVRQLLDLAQTGADQLALPDDAESAASWLQLSTLATQVLALYPTPRP
jgi:ParB-like chromosome segregation protein Spo0J